MKLLWLNRVSNLLYLLLDSIVTLVDLNVHYSTSTFSLAFKDNVLILFGLQLIFNDGIVSCSSCFLSISLGILRRWTRFLLTTVVGVSIRYDLGCYDGLITVPVQPISVM